jgi:mRNA interferase HigB
MPVWFPEWEFEMRVIARSVLVDFGERHPLARPALEHWYRVARGARWTTTQEIMAALVKAKALSADRVRFEIGGGRFRLIVAFDFGRQIAFVKFVGTHAEYDRVDALTVSSY